MAGPKEKVWKLDPHTLAKHEILRRYLDAWFPIMSKWNHRVVFLDGFAGPGIYENDEPGSPIIALQALIKHPQFARFGEGRTFVFLFCEDDADRHESLLAQLELYKQELGGSWPGNVLIDTRNQAFDSAATELLAYMVEQNKQLAPTFAFIDPFGVKGLPMEMLVRLVASPKCELFVNMIMNTAKRFATSGQIDGSLTSLYGTASFKDADGREGRERIVFLHDLYANQLRTEAGLPYVQSFEMINRGGHTSYFLFYATRAIEGLRAMKAAMWRSDPGGGYRFSDRLVGQDVFFTEEFLDVSPLRTALLEHFRGRAVDIRVVEEFTLSQTPYREEHLRKPILGPWEKDGTIIATREPGKRQFPPGTRIKFPD